MLNELSIFELQDLIRKKEIKTLDIAKACVTRINTRDDMVHAWIDFDENDVFQKSKKIDENQSLLGLLHGIPVGMKDIIDVAGLHSRRGSEIYQDRIATTDAHVVSLVKAAGSFILGKTVTTEFASGNPNITRNPHNLDYTPGGSSSGSAAAVADFMVPYSFGTQTAGSMVRPAAFCGISAMKPSFGTLSRAGLSYVADSLDTIGWFARDVKDLGIIFHALTGKDIKWNIEHDMRQLKIGVCKTPDWNAAEPVIQNLVNDLEESFAASNILFNEVTLPKEFELLGEIQNRLMCKEMTFWLEEEWKNHSELLSDYIIERLEFGSQISSDQLLLDNVIIEHCRAYIDSLFSDFDYIITPSAPGPAPQGIITTGNSIFNRMWTLLHLPCIALPMTKNDDNLPMGLQIIGKFQDDVSLLANGYVFQEWLKSHF